MRGIKLYRGEIALVDDDDYNMLSSMRWHTSKQGYAISTQRREFDGNQYKVRMHRLIMKPPDDMYVDHINGNKLDNRKSNLRIVTPHENCFNTRKRDNTTSKYKGVTFNKAMNMWKGTLKYDGKYVHIGYFRSEKACGLAYNEFAEKYFGEYAKKNIIVGSENFDWKSFLYIQDATSKVRGVCFNKKGTFGLRV